MILSGTSASWCVNLLPSVLSLTLPVTYLPPRSYNNQLSPTNKTIRKQDQAEIDKAVKFVLSFYFIWDRDFQFAEPDSRRTEGGWPVKATIQQYLDNCTDKHTRDLRLEHEAEAADCDDGSTPQASNFNECQIQNRRGDNAEDAMNEHGG
ncbi:hypothetical protein B0H13DRAFT_1909440 [Mycena leptocephala]|nr:hypothetical protein B0H13DRAFT_1909440 [Mycena leptocephala]